jgi:hypothetical protein
MNIERISQAVTIKCNLSASDWQLYNIPGRDLAAEQLNRAVEEKLAKGELSSITSVLEPFSEFGATDTEGYLVLEQVLKHAGIDPNKYI